MRLAAASLDRLAAGAAAPTYARGGGGIVHLGAGAFFRSHLAYYTDAALAARGGGWAITAASLRSSAAVDALGAQDGLYTLLVRDADGTTARVIGSVARALFLRRDRAQILRALVDPGTRIVSLTITEKAYARGSASGGPDPSDAAIAADLAHPEEPRTPAGLLVQALARRKAGGVAPFVVLSCDNLPANGAAARRTVAGLARLLEPELAAWIEDEVSFPATMVDRITPAASAATLADARELTGLEDRAAVECEGFCQWVIEDAFPRGRPAWDAAGAIMVADVSPYERMKLRMLNGAHSLLAYAGCVAGHRHVRDCMACPLLGRLARLHMERAGAGLPELAGIRYPAYAAQLCARFANPALAHATSQIAADGSRKMPPRIIEPACEAYQAGRPLATFAFALAAWVRFCRALAEDGGGYAINDPLAASFAACLAREGAPAKVRAFMALVGFEGGAPADALSAEAARLLDVIEAEGVLAAAAGVLEDG